MERSDSTNVVSTLEEYIKKTSEIRNEWYGKSRNKDPWFRGVLDEQYELLPGFYRASDPKNEGREIREGALREEFERRAPPLLEGHPPATKWEWYFLMQHYGLPTRLLDWSESSLIGLYFAVADWDGKRQVGNQDAAVWMLDPHSLEGPAQQQSKPEDEIYRYDSQEIDKYLPDDRWDLKLPEKPVAFMPLNNSRRITAQRGMFTIHGTDNRPLEKMIDDKGNPRLVKFVIPKLMISEVNCSLRVAGITDVVAIPELPSLCLDMCHYYFSRKGSCSS